MAVSVKGGAGGAGKAGGAGGAGGGRGKGKGGKGKGKKGGGKKKKKHKCGDSGKYGDMQDNYSANGMERDHVPSGASLVQKAQNMLGKPPCNSQARRIKRAASACAIPKGVHADFSETFRGRNTTARIQKDAAGLQKAAKSNTAKIQKGLKGRSSKECQRKYRQWANQVNKRNNRWYENMIKKALPDKKWT